MAINVGQVSVGTAATLIVPPRPPGSFPGGTLRQVTIANPGTGIYIGPDATVTTTGGHLLTGAITINTYGAIYGIIGSATQTVTYLDNYN